MGSLLNHPKFRLIFIDDNGKMSLKTPALDEAVREDILEKRYRCISHLWGNVRNSLWKRHDISHVNWKVFIREEKRERIMEIFKHYKGYFWMDVFCTNQGQKDKALDIMGDIYKNCEECICMLDIPQDYSCHAESYRSNDESVPEYNAIGPLTSFAIRDQPEPEYKPPNNELFASFMMSCEWGKRVWTWQESVLPNKVSFCAETWCNCGYRPMTRKLFNEMCDDLYWSGNREMALLIAMSRIKDGERLMEALRSSTRRCADQEDYIYGILGLLNINMPSGLKALEVANRLQKELDRRNINLVILESNYPWKNLGKVFGDRMKLQE